VTTLLTFSTSHAGLDPNRALVFGLQARGDKLISRDFCAAKCLSL